MTVTRVGCAPLANSAYALSRISMNHAAETRHNILDITGGGAKHVVVTGVGLITVTGAGSISVTGSRACSQEHGVMRSPLIYKTYCHSVKHCGQFP